MIKRSEKGSITLFTLIAMMFFLTIAFTAYASAMAKLQAQNEDLERIKASYEQDLTEEGLAKLYNELTGTREWLQGAGTEQDPYKIYTIEDLLELSNRTNSGTSFANKYIDLMNDLDFNDVRSYVKYDRTDFGDVNGNGTVEELRKELTTGEGWQAIGTETKSFKGNFDGNNNQIKNLYINTSKNYQGLFGCVRDANLQNITIYGKIDGNRSLGGIVGVATNTMIINITNNCIIQSTGYYVGGIIGIAKSTLVEKCVNNSQIQSEGKYVGGIVGVIDSTLNEGNNPTRIEKCKNIGKIIGKHSTGGICGEQSNNTIVKLCINYGYIRANKSDSDIAQAGGIVGFNKNSQIFNCYNVGQIETDTVASRACAGGVAGANTYESIITNCYSIGIISEYKNNGGIIGMTINASNDPSNSYWLSTCGVQYGIGSSKSNNGAISKTDVDMKLQSFVDLLNSNNTEQPWTMDTNNINNGYPILKWQLNQ